jgi:hypothetical protein
MLLASKMSLDPGARKFIGWTAYVHCDIPNDLTLSAEERRHPLTPHLVVFTIEVWRT